MLRCRAESRPHGRWLARPRLTSSTASWMLRPNSCQSFRCSGVPHCPRRQGTGWCCTRLQFATNLRKTMRVSAARPCSVHAARTSDIPLGIVLPPVGCEMAARCGKESRNGGHGLPSESQRPKPSTWSMPALPSQGPTSDSRQPTMTLVHPFSRAARRKRPNGAELPKFLISRDIGVSLKAESVSITAVWP